jgi:predicted transglutaminase-like protease
MEWKRLDGMKVFCKTEHDINSPFTLSIFQCMYFISFSEQAALILWWTVIIDSFLMYYLNHLLFLDLLNFLQD